MAAATHIIYIPVSNNISEKCFVACFIRNSMAIQSCKVMTAILLGVVTRNWRLGKYSLYTFLAICMTNNTAITGHYNMHPVTVRCTSEHCQEIQKCIGSSSSNTQWMNIVCCIYLVPFISDAFGR